MTRTEWEEWARKLLVEYVDEQEKIVECIADLGEQADILAKVRKVVYGQ